MSGTKDGGQLHLRSSVIIPPGSVDAREVVVLTPVLIALDGSRSVSFGSVAIIGRNRAKALERNSALGLFEWDVQPERTILLKKEQEIVGFAFDVPYQEWMRNAEFVCLEEGSGCIRTQTTHQTHSLISRVLPPAYVPTYQLCYVNPPAEPVKQRSESYAARLNFRVNRYEILNDYMNNATVLREVNEIIEEIKGDANLNITEFRITGYASPEGGVASNMTLSENRAKSFVNYLRNRHSISRDEIGVEWKGDDWDGLRKLMKESDFVGANDVIAILDATQDAVQRKNRLKALPSYRTLLDEYYPYLRRNEYTISYIARPFSIEEAKAIILTKPQQLSLNEMYLVANTYPKGSPEFKQVFDVAVRMFPDSDYANLNSGAVEIETERTTPPLPACKKWICPKRGTT